MPDTLPQVNLHALLVEKDEMNAGVKNQIAAALAESPAQFKALRDVADKLEAHRKAGKGDAAKLEYKLGVVYYYLGRMARSVELLQNGKAPLAQYIRGLALLELGRHEEAMGALDGAAKAGYAASDVQLHKAAALRGLGRFDEALDTLDKLEPYVKKTAEYLFQLGAIHAARGDTPLAVGQFEKALAADGRHAGALFRLAYHNDMQGNDDDAIGLYERALAAGPAKLGVLINLGVLYEDSFRYDRAAYCYEQILAVDPNHPRARLFLLDARAAQEQAVEEDTEKLATRGNALLDTPVTEFEMSVRARNCLKRMNIRTVGDLTMVSEQQLLTSKNFGETSLQEVKNIMGIKGLRLGQGLEQAPKRTHPSFNPDDFGPQEQASFTRPVGELQLSVRARKCMSRLGINTVGDLIAHSGDELLECKNFGVTSLVEVRGKLKELNLKLRGD